LAAHNNGLIALLTQADRAQFVSLCTPVPLLLRSVLAERGARVRHVYFPTTGYISLVEQIAGEPGLEVGLIGSEGMLGAHIALDVAAAPQHALVQGSGSALRIGSRAFTHALTKYASLDRVVRRYLYVAMTQLASSSACMRFHQIEPRLARWLLMSQDRAGQDTFHMTQAFLAYMLGVRRVGVTSAASKFAARGLIAYRRGELTVIDRAGLAIVACSCYESDTLNYKRHLG
jgi:CRP-like cAMP-binding protein